MPRRDHTNVNQGTKTLHDTPPAMMSDHLIRHTTLRQLQIFEASVRFGSFTRAAEALFLTQPTVSMQIKKLADTLGLPLFEQVGRKIRPTEAGTELYKSCRQIFATLSNLEVKMADLKGIKTGRLTLGVITTAKCFAPEILGEFCQLYPGIEVALNVFNRDQIIDRIKNNEDDLYIMGQAPVEQRPSPSRPIRWLSWRHAIIPWSGRRIFHSNASPRNPSFCASRAQAYVMPCCVCSMRRI